MATQNKDNLTEVSSVKCFSGFQKVFSHSSEETSCIMKFGIYIPPQAESEKVPVIFFLSGLTCTEQNFITKSGIQKYASKHGVIVVNPDTSPRGCSIEGEDDAYDHGSGAGFYVDATEEKWKKHYRMYSYVTRELPELVSRHFNADISRMSIMGHSMGGHGAQVCALRNPGLYKSVSSFAPICNPINCQWGLKNFTGYLGENKEEWKKYDSCELVKNYNGPPLPLLVDQGKSDSFLGEGQLLPDNLVSACASAAFPIVMRMQEGYDHSYYFISTFIEEHVEHHVKYLKA